MKTKTIGQCKDCKFWDIFNSLNGQFYICKKEVGTPKHGQWSCWYWKEKKK